MMVQEAPPFGTETPAKPAMEALERENRREEIVRYIESCLHPDLAVLYADAIRSSVSTGCHDTDWVRGAPFPLIQKYVAGLYQDFMGKQGDMSGWLVKIALLSDDEKQHAWDYLEKLAKKKTS